MNHLILVFLTVTKLYSLPPGLQSALCFVESSHNVKAVHHDDGSANSVGVCQVQLPTARVLGFKGSETELYRVDTNVNLSGAYISKQLRRYNGDVVKAISAYNMGTYRVGKDGFPKNKKYVLKVLKAWGEGR